MARQETSEKSGLNKIIGALALTVVVVLAYYAFQYAMRPPLNPDVEQGRAIVDTFLKKLHDKQAGEAWDTSSAEFKSLEGRESFIRKTKSTPLLTEPMLFGSTQDVQVNDTQRTEFLFTSSQSGKSVRVLLGNEAGTWKVDRLTY